MMNFRTGFSPRGMLIQLQGKQSDAADRNVIEYLQSYFGRKSFDIEWNDAEHFVQELWNAWNALWQDRS